MWAKIMAEQRFYSPLRIGLSTVVMSYFLFTLHAMFTISWIGEWEGLPEPIATWIFVTDVFAGFTLAFRFAAGIIAVATIIFFFMKRNISATTTFKVLRWVLIFEALYWIGLLPSGVWGIMPVNGLLPDLIMLLTMGVPCLVSSIAIPIALFKLASKLKPNKSMADATK